MTRKMFLVFLSLLALILSAPGMTRVARAADAPPYYGLQYLGPGSPVAINNSGTVVGARLTGSVYEPLVSSGGAAWSLLPVPAGMMSTFPTDINDSGVIVGTAFSPSFVGVAVRWLPSPAGYTVEILPRLPGDDSSYASAINNLGQIVGARRTLGYVPAATTGWLYSDALGVVDLFAAYGWAVSPTELNDNGILIGGVERLDLNTGILETLPPGPANYQAIGGRYINNSGQIAGTAPTTSTSLNIVSAFRYDPAAGWTFIAGTSRFTTITSMNSLGDIAYGELGTGLHLAGLGNYALGALLNPAATTAGWAITGSGAKINDQLMAAAMGQNSLTGQSGAVLLTPQGVQPPPSAPANLAGIPHPATRSEPYNSINLTWENTSVLTTGYELARSLAGANTWTALALTPPGTAANHTDTTVGVGVTYDYRVRAVGVGGAGPWSNIATVTAPATPLDTTPPSVSILSPANGGSVSGVVAISAQASDDVAVEYLEISYWNQFLGQQVILGSVSNAGSLSVNWDTGALTPATYTVRAYAYDTLGNWSQSEITVNVTAALRSMVVSDIALSGTARGSSASITGYVYVKDASGAAVSNATVTVRWTLPNGSKRTAIAATNVAGRARFLISGGRGTYTLTVVNVTRSGYVFDPANSVLSKSIRK